MSAEATITAVNAVCARTGDAALLTRFLLAPVAETATTEPIVADGTGAFPPSSAFASSERAANPMDGGLKRKTEYTFFYQRRVSFNTCENIRIVNTHQESVTDDPCRCAAASLHFEKCSDTLRLRYLRELEVVRADRPARTTE